MRVGVDEAGVENLLGKRPDELVRSLEKTTRRHCRCYVSSLDGLFCRTHVFQAESLPLDLLHVVDFAAVAELGRQNPLFFFPRGRQTETGWSKLPLEWVVIFCFCFERERERSSPCWCAARRLWGRRRRQSASARWRSAPSSWPRSQSPAPAPAFPSGPGGGTALCQVRPLEFNLSNKVRI